MDGSRGAQTAVARWDDLGQAFQAYHFPSENLSFVRGVMAAVGIDHYEDIPSRTYLKAIRSAGGRTLTIHSGYTSGFASEAEVVAAAGDVLREGSGSDWYVVHPVNDVGEHHRGGFGSTRERGPAATCERCGLELPLSGVCDDCASPG